MGNPMPPTAEGLARLVFEDRSQCATDDLQVQAQALVAEVEEFVLQLLEGVDVARLRSRS